MTKIKWIESPEALLLMLDDEKRELAVFYQDFIDEYENDLDDGEELADFDLWYEGFLEDQRFFNSPEWNTEMDRLNEKD